MVAKSSLKATHSLLGKLLPVAEHATVSVVHLAAEAMQNEPVAVTLCDPNVHLLVICAENVDADVHVTVAPGVKERDCACVMEVHVSEGATLRITVLQDAPNDCAVTLSQRSQTSAGGFVHWSNVTLGGCTVSHDLQSVATGASARSDIDWVFYAKDKEQQTLSVRNVFAARDGRGEILLKGVAEEDATVSADGMIAIGEGGGGTDTYLTEDVLMLDASSKVDAVPGLEIKTDDVKASHSATVSRMTDDDLFYCASRGIEAHTARALFVVGFLGDVLQRLRNAELREMILRRISKKYLH